MKIVVDAPAILKHLLIPEVHKNVLLIHEVLGEYGLTYIFYLQSFENPTTKTSHYTTR